MAGPEFGGLRPGADDLSLIIRSPARLTSPLPETDVVVYLF